MTPSNHSLRRLTKKQLLVIDYFKQLQPIPRLNEITKFAKLSSNRSTIDMLKVLERKGYLIRNGKKTKDYRLTILPIVRDFTTFSYNSGGTTI